MFISIFISMLLFQTNFISWPVANHFPFRGYGDYNGIAEFHTGLDFFAMLEEDVNVPEPGQLHYVVDVIHNPSVLNDVIVVLSPGPETSSTGWAYEHLDYTIVPLPIAGHVLPAITTTLTTCTPGSGDEPQHVHLARFDGWKLNPYPHSTISHLVQNSPYNVFMDLEPSFDPYDYPEFTSVEYYTGGETGIVFMPDESTVNPLSRDDIYGKVDMLVSAVNYFNGAKPYDQDYCCVGAIRYRILNWNYYNERYDSTRCDWRIVYDMLGFLPGALDTIPATWSDEFLRIYKWNQADETKFANIQCITNCGTMNSVSNCLDNVWVDEYCRGDDHNDWEYCRGAWDTRIGTDILANCNDNAYFKDGRYAIELEAISQRSRISILDTLPVSNLMDANDNDNITGIIVDNYYPFISKLGLYNIYESNYYDLWSATCYPYDSNDPDNQAGPPPENYDRYWYSEGNLYLPTSIDLDLAVAVMTSEVAKFDYSGVNLHLETEIGDIITWETDISFTLDEWDPSLFIPTGTDEGVALYTAPTYRMPDEYTGRIKATLEIGNIALDLAGNHLDMDPLSWMSPRDTTLTGLHDMSEWDNTPMTVSHEWGTASGYIAMYSGDPPPAWIGPDGWIQGYANDYVVDVYINQPSYQYDIMIGDCPWLCGFWVLMNNDNLTAPFGYAGTAGAYTVDCFGNINTTFEVLYGEEVQPQIYGGVVSIDGRVGWIGISNHRPHPLSYVRYTDLYVAACNTENGEHVPYFIDTGYSWYNKQDLIGEELLLNDDLSIIMTDSTQIQTGSTQDPMGWSKIHFTGINANGDATFKAYVWENIGDPYPIITEYTIPCPWPMISGDKLSLFSGDRLSLSNNDSSSIEFDATYEPELMLPFPNPTMETVNISFTLANSGPVSIIVYDLSGRIVYNHARGDYAAGTHNVSWSLITNSGHRAPSGMYLILFESEDINETQRLVIID